MAAPKSKPTSLVATKTTWFVVLFTTLIIMLFVIVGITSVSAVENVVEEKIVHVKQDHQTVPQEQGEGVVVDDGNNLVFAPECDPKCESTEFCNFMGQCEPYPILIMECEVGSSCDRCHCSGSCVDGVCQSK